MVYLVALLPVVILVLFIYFVDRYQHEPWPQILKAVGAGVLSAIVTVLVLYKLDFQFEFGVGGAIADAFVNAAIPEEAAKLLMLWLVLRRNRHFDEYFDGVVYAVCVGMGFAGLENIFYLIDEEDMMAVGIARGVFSIPAHFMFAVAMGYYYSLVHFRCHQNNMVKYWNMACVFVVPVLLHGSYDAFLMVMETGMEDNFQLVGLCLIAFVGICIFMGIFAFFKCRKLLRQDKAYFDYLAQQQMAQYWQQQMTSPSAPAAQTTPASPTAVSPSAPPTAVSPSASPTAQ